MHPSTHGSQLSVYRWPRQPRQLAAAAWTPSSRPAVLWQPPRRQRLFAARLQWLLAARLQRLLAVLLQRLFAARLLAARLQRPSAAELLHGTTDDFVKSDALDYYIG